MGNPFKVLHEKLRATAKALTRWSSKLIGNLKLQILVTIEVIFRLDVAMEARALSHEEVGLRWIHKRKLLGLSSLERTMARLRSGQTWHKEGDASTRFFHQHANHRHRRNVITQLHVEGALFRARMGCLRLLMRFILPHHLSKPLNSSNLILTVGYLEARRRHKRGKKGCCYWMGA